MLYEQLNEFLDTIAQAAFDEGIENDEHTYFASSDARIEVEVVGKNRTRIFKVSWIFAHMSSVYFDAVIKLGYSYEITSVKDKIKIKFW